MRTVMLSWLVGMQVLYRMLSYYVHLPEQIWGTGRKREWKKIGRVWETKRKGKIEREREGNNKWGKRKRRKKNKNGGKRGEEREKNAEILCVIYVINRWRTIHKNLFILLSQTTLSTRAQRGECAQFLYSSIIISLCAI